jgi:cell filamentation protein
VRFLSQNVDELFARLHDENCLKGMSIEQFAVRSGFYFGELNVLHPFREGNGRTQRELIRQLATVSGHRMNWSLVGRNEMIAASIDSHIHGRNEGFVALLRKAMGL